MELATRDHAAVFVGLGEAMHRAAEIDKLPIGAGRAHLGFEGVDVDGGNEAIVGTVQHQYRGLDVASPGRGTAAERAMKADHSAQFRAAAGKFEHRRATEAEANGTDGVLGQRRSLEGAQGDQCRVDALAHLCAVGREGTGGYAGFLRIAWAQAATVHVDEQDDVIIARDGFRLRHRRVGDAVPVRHHQQTRARRGARIVVDEDAVKTHATDDPTDRPSDRCSGGKLRGGIVRGVLHGETPSRFFRV